MSWLRSPAEARHARVAVLPSVTPVCGESTVNRKLSVTWNLAAAETISLRYEHGLSLNPWMGDFMLASTRLL